METHLLPDVLAPELKVVFCGTAAGRVSAEAESYYAHPNNKFWNTLAETGLTDRRLKPHEFREVIKFGLGLTDLCKDSSGNDNQIPGPTPAQRAALKEKVGRFRPGILAFTSLEAGKRYFGSKVRLGRQTEKIEDTTIVILPSTSPMAAWNWNATRYHWEEFARTVRGDK
jgi:TDG/mug DNA glycosylase family protein